MPLSYAYLSAGVRQSFLSAALLLGFAIAAGPEARGKHELVTVPADSFVHLSDEAGLAHSDVRSVAQDRDGFIWFGLRLGGLTRYDGYEFKVYQHDPADPRSIGNRVIWSVLVDRSGVLWIGTEGGLDRYDRETDTFKHYRHDPMRAGSLPNNVVLCLLEDSAGKLWAGTRQGLCRLDDAERGTFTTFSRPQLVGGSNAKDTFRSIIEDPTTGLLWLGATDGLAAFDPKTGKFASYIRDPGDSESLSHNGVNKVIRGSDGTFWAMTEVGINAFTPSLVSIPEHTLQQPRLSFRRFFQANTASASGANFFRDGLVDRQGRFWLATRAGLALFDRENATFTAYRRKPFNPASLSDDMTQTLFEDRDGNLWIGTYSGGPNLLRRAAKPFQVHRHDPGDPSSLSEDRITGIAFDASQRLWISTVKGLNRQTEHGWKRFVHDPADPTSLPSDDIGSLASGPNADVWVGSNYGGLYRFDQERFHSYPTRPTSSPAPSGWQTFSGVQIHSILPDAKGGAWLAARSYGIDYFSNGKFLHFSPQESVNLPAQPTTNAIFGFIAADETVWYITELDGLVQLDPKVPRFTAYEAPSEGPGTKRNLLCLAEDKDGGIWIGTSDGLLYFDSKTKRFLRDYSTADGLPHDAIVSIVRDRRGHLWLGTANGLADFDPVSEKFRNYDKADGLPSNVFSQRCGVLGPDGRVYLGTRGGLVAFAPEELHDNLTPPHAVFTDLRWLGAAPKSVERAHAPFAHGGTLHVPAGQFGFTLKFSALDFTAPEKNRFRYRLEGLNERWSYSDAGERSATYTALPPGSYRFVVQASNADLVWNEQGTALAIVVAPRLWQTAWFRVAVGLTLAGAFAATVQGRLRRVRVRNELLERQVSQRTTELQQEVLVRKQAETALRESHADLEERVQSRTAQLAQTNVSLRTEIAERKNVESQLRQSQKMEAIGQLASGVAHDFNNLLTVILGQSELMRDPQMPPQVRELALRDVHSAAQRATNLTRQLLVLSRDQPVNPAAHDLNRIVTNVSKLLGHAIGKKIAFQTQLHREPLGVLADAGMLEQVLLNMAVNARDAMPRGGRLSISTRPVLVTQEQARRSGPHARAGSYACCCVSDTGTGIPTDILPQIFDPFFTTKDAGKGTGLGLAISLGIVQKHHGWIDVETKANAGTTFQIYLPSHSSAAVIPGPKRKVQPHAVGNTTVLLVEDELAVRSVVHIVLERQGYRVIEAVSGADALEQWAVHRDEVTILITDIVMPGWPDGHELAARLCAEKPSLRVVTMSGYDPGEGSGTQRARLPKPFTAGDLLATLDGTLRR